MKIDDRVERIVRTALDAAVKRDPKKLDEALRSFPNDDAVRKGIELALAVCGFVMIDVHGGRPTDGQIRAVADKLADMEHWARPTPDEVHNFLTTVLSGTSFPAEVPSESVIILAFVVAANLLASFRKEDDRWYDYLDRAEAAIEASR
jgi:hypothetical protein